MPHPKRYDRRYYERFYRAKATRVLTPAERRLRVAAVVALAEHHLGRRLRSALDVGCGAGLWGRELVRLRPGLRYLGLRPFAGGRRPGAAGPGHPARAASKTLPPSGGARFDLVLCADVLHYLDARADGRRCPRSCRARARSALSGSADFRRSGRRRPRGAAAAFARLVPASASGGPA